MTHSEKLWKNQSIGGTKTKEKMGWSVKMGRAQQVETEMPAVLHCPCDKV